MKWRYQISPRGDSLLRGSKIKRVSKRSKALLILSIVFLTFTGFLSDGILRLQQRRLKCKELSELKAEQQKMEDGDVVRHLNRFSKFVDRILENGSSNPCLTDFPAEADSTQFIVNQEIQIELDEPKFTVADSGGGSFRSDVDTTIVINNYITLDEAERSLVTVYDPVAYDAESAVREASRKDLDTIAYVVTLTGCPGWYEIREEPILASDLYEESAILKAEVCENTEAAATNRRLGKTRKLAELGDRPSAAEMNYTMHAILHPTSTECPVEGTEGETYNRVKLLQSENYHVEILGQPITFNALNQAGHIYISDNIADDIGIRDSMKLHAWKFDSHPVVVLLGYDTMITQPIDHEIDLLLINEDLKGMYIKTPPDQESGKSGVDTGFLIIKPNTTEFDNILHEYLNTPYDPQTGWDNKGHNMFEGGMGLPGFLSYYFEKDPGYVELDRCTFGHTVDEDCLGQIGFDICKATKMYEQVCGKPRDCPYDDPSWSVVQRAACEAMHRKYFEYRYNFVEEYFNKLSNQERIGFFKTASFLGYCIGPGRNSLLTLTQALIPKPDWQTVCPPIICPQGTYMKPDCTCSHPYDPCEACPINTRCQTSPTFMCIDCNCGFCDGGHDPCCQDNGRHDCMRGFGEEGFGDEAECAMQNNFFPSFSGSGFICGSEVSRTAVPNGCGCVPTPHSPCTYNPEWGEKEEKCFVCTADDLAVGQCETCKDCLSQCPNGDCLNTSFTTSDFMSCLSSISDIYCRASCHYNCMKN